MNSDVAKRQDREIVYDIRNIIINYEFIRLHRADHQKQLEK